MNVQESPKEEPVKVDVFVNSLCAWCLDEQGISAGEGSHGICKKHANRFLLDWEKLRRKRIEG